MSQQGEVGFSGNLQPKVIRAKPTLRQRLLDWLDSIKRKVESK